MIVAGRLDIEVRLYFSKDRRSLPDAAARQLDGLKSPRR
jgi:hypothetical protein